MNTSRTLAYVAGFGIARGGLFIAPILLANLIPLSTYGSFEFSLAIAAIFALVLGCGLQATVPLILLRAEVTARWDTLLWLLSRISILGFLGAFIAWIIKGTGFDPWVLTPLAAGVLTLQTLWSTTLKSRGQSTSAVFLEAGIWSFAVAGASLAFFGGLSMTFISVAIAIYGGLLLSVTLTAQLATSKPFSSIDIKENISLGFPLMITAIFALLVSSSGRVVIGSTSDIETIGIYAILYRATALPLVAHQLLVISLFQRLFVWEMPTLQRRAPFIVFGVATFVVAFWILAGPLGWLLGPKFIEAFTIFPIEGHVILIQTILWSAIALNDLLVSRLRIAGQVAWFVGGYLIIALPVLVLLTSVSSEKLFTFVMFHAALMLGYYLVQCVAIWQLGHRFGALWGSTVMCFTAGLAVLFFLQSFGS